VCAVGIPAVEELFEELLGGEEAFRLGSADRVVAGVGQHVEDQLGVSVHRMTSAEKAAGCESIAAAIERKFPSKEDWSMRVMRYRFMREYYHDLPTLSRRGSNFLPHLLGHFVNVITFTMSECTPLHPSQSEERGARADQVSCSGWIMRMAAHSGLSSSKQIA
jgi:hypothetical protein